MIASCSSGETPQGEVQAPTETMTETPSDTSPEVSPPTQWTEASTIISGMERQTPTYYEELKDRCGALGEAEQAWCNASISAMQSGGYREVDYNAEGESLPCSEGQQSNTIRSPGSLTWCEPLPQ